MKKTQSKQKSTAKKVKSSVEEATFYGMPQSTTNRNLNAPVSKQNSYGSKQSSTPPRIRIFDSNKNFDANSERKASQQKATPIKTQGTRKLVRQKTKTKSR
jgi:hypothetical protein